MEARSPTAPFIGLRLDISVELSVSVGFVALTAAEVGRIITVVGVPTRLLRVAQTLEAAKS